MTRPKVPDDKRQRTAQACETCKRRKQKCNGQNPCSACLKRSSECTYKTEPVPETAPPQKTSSIKRRLVEISDPPTGSQITGEQKAAKKPAIRQGSVTTPTSTRRSVENGITSLPSIPPPVEDVIHRAPYDCDSQQSTVSGPDDEAEVYTETRMLQAPNGRLIYLGDSATLSCLQILRFIVGEFESCDFTDDPSRHKFMENMVDFDSNQELPGGINPPTSTVEALLTSFFTNTHGLLDLFNRADFERAVYACAGDPFAGKPGIHSLMYLNFATGLVLATPKPGSDEHVIIGHLQRSKIDVAESYFRAAQRHMDPLTAHERGDFWTVQVLCLMAVYSLSVSRRNAAVSYLSMAVQFAFTLGLHRGEQTQVIFPLEEQIVRRRVWRSLFVLDRFLAAALGRPVLISDEDCSSDSLRSLSEQPNRLSENDRSMNIAVDISMLIGRILKTVYARRRVSTKLAHEFALDCQKLDKQLQGEFHWRRAVDPSTPIIEATAVLHLNLYRYHAVLLYTRPFFLYLLKNFQVDKVPPTRFSPRMQRFSQTCVKAAEHTITIVYGALRAGYLPQRNPFVTHFLFAASLVILGNEFAKLHVNHGYQEQISSVVKIIRYCAETDPQALRLTYIVDTFCDVVARRHRSQSFDVDGPRAPPYSASARETISSGSSRNPKIDSHPLNAPPPLSDGPPTGGARSTIESPLGYPSHNPALQEASFRMPTVSGASPVSSGGSLRGSDGLAGRRASDVNTPIGEDEVNLDVLWPSARGDGVTDAGIATHDYPLGLPKAMPAEASSYGMYAAFMHGHERPI